MRTSSLFIILGISVVFSTSLVTGLFLASEEAIDRNNAFIRRYPHHPQKEIASLDLGYNSYYFAGADKNFIYLGNQTAPLHVLKISKTLQDTSHVTLKPKDITKYGLRSLRFQVSDYNYYLSDGSVPVIFKGNLTNWKSNPVPGSGAYFNLLTHMEKENFVIRTQSAATREIELGYLRTGDMDTVTIQPQLIKKQIDGIFDADGKLLYNEQLKKIIYIYSYRNSFLVLDKNVKLDYQGKTIDTVSIAQLEIASIPSKGQQKLRVPPVKINKAAATNSNFLMVQSERLGKFEPEEMLDQASIIDVYDLVKNIYHFSFYAYDYQKESLRDFIIEDSLMYGLLGDYLVSYKLKTNY